jgi:hypothetical protein
VFVLVFVFALPHAAQSPEKKAAPDEPTADDL